MILHRKQDWMKHFIKSLDDKKNVKFQYGNHDCCISVADCIRAMTDVDIACEYRGYSRLQIAELLKNKGGMEKLVVEVFDKYHVLEIPVLKATQGDVCMISPKGRATMAVVATDGRHVLAAGSVGWTMFPLSSADRAWRIG